MMEYRNGTFLENGWIDCEINHPNFGWIPFTIDPHKDPELYEEAKITSIPYDPEANKPSFDMVSTTVRMRRDALLLEDDWRTTKAFETGSPLSAGWLAYRQALRDITDHVNFPYLDEADWPVKPV